MMNYRDQIMNLPQTPGLPMVNATVAQLLAYKIGYRDARDAAAEIAGAADAHIARLNSAIDRLLSDELTGNAKDVP